MSQLTVGSYAPDFTLNIDGGDKITLSECRGKKVVLYFYPKDDTPGCTKEAIAFRDYKNQLEAENTQVIGISKDSASCHDKFKEKHNLNFILASDEEGSVVEAYDSWVEKNMYGKKYMGIQRDTFLIDENGKISQIWRKVKVDGHAQAVLSAVRGV